MHEGHYPDEQCSAACNPTCHLATLYASFCRLLLDRQLLSFGNIETWQPSDSPDSPARSLILDAKALENLEVFENSSDRGAKGTLFSVLDHCSSPFGKRKLRSWLCRPLALVADINERQQAVAALMTNKELSSLLQSGLKKLPDMERLLAQINAFSIAQAANNATHYEDVGRKRLNEFIRCLEGFELLSATIKKARHIASDIDSTQLTQALTTGEGFPAIDIELANLRNAFDWQAARSDGRIVPAHGQDELYDAALAAMEKAAGALEEIRLGWVKHFGDKSIEYWTPAGSTTEPFQLVVSEDTLKRRGTPDSFSLMSSKKGWKRFWNDEIREQVQD